VVIFIDDLDCCPLNKVVDVLEAIKLLLEKRIFITFLGLDSRVISRAIEHRYADMWADAPTDGKGGMEYLEKIIQLPFHLPRPSPSYLGDYVKTLTVSPALSTTATTVSGPTGSTEEQTVPPVSPTTDTRDTSKPDSRSTAPEAKEKPVPPPAIEAPPALLEETAEEVAALTTIIPMAATNPRKIKRLVNVYRFVKLLALLQHNYQGNQAFPTPMVKWLTICECWPSFTRCVVTRWREKTAPTMGDTDFLNSCLSAYGDTMEEQKPPAAVPEQLRVFLQTGPQITSSFLDDLIPLSINFTHSE
jgi:hypothetical protein